MCSVEIISKTGCFLFGNSPSDWSIQQDGAVMVRSEDGDKGHFVKYKHLILMQFTGLYDKWDKKEIYEGDIVQKIWGTGFDGAELPGQYIFFDQQKCAYMLKGIGKDSNLNSISDYKLIGNIYQHPENIGLKNNNQNKPDYCEIGMIRCVSCGWEGEYPVSGCPKCNKSFVE